MTPRAARPKHETLTPKHNIIFQDFFTFVESNFTYPTTMSVQLDQVKQSAGKIARRTLWILLAALLLFSIGYYIYRTYTISEGTRTGMLFKISKKGVMFKTYEGQLHLGGSTILTQQSTWEFSVQNETVYQQAQQFDGRNVKVHYKELVNPFPWQGDTHYIVYKVEPIQ